MFKWLKRILRSRLHPRPGFRFECLSDGYWLCRICNQPVMDRQMGVHAEKFHGWVAPHVRITQPH
mgnify:FL=1